MPSPEDQSANVDIGRIYVDLIRVCEDNNMALAVGKEFYALLKTRGDAAKITQQQQNMDPGCIDKAVCFLYNLGVTNLENMKPVQAENFISLAMDLMPYCTSNFADSVKDNMTATYNCSLEMKNREVNKSLSLFADDSL